MPITKNATPPQKHVTANTTKLLFDTKNYAYSIFVAVCKWTKKEDKAIQHTYPICSKMSKLILFKIFIMFID